MKNRWQSIYQNLLHNKHTQCILVVEKDKPVSPMTNNFDAIILVITQETEEEWIVNHYEYDHATIAMHVITIELLTEWIETNEYRIAIEWVIYGDVVFDRNDYSIHLKGQLYDFPHQQRKRQTVIEFGKLIKSHNEVKDLYASKQYKDAYSRMVHSLHYLARLAVIHHGLHPEVTVWNQVKEIDSEIYKLYDELIQSNEEIEKRVQLMILAVDFAMGARCKSSSNYLLEILRSTDEGVSYNALQKHPQISPYVIELHSLITYLVEKGIIQSRLEETDKDGVYKRKYWVIP